MKLFNPLLVLPLLLSVFVFSCSQPKKGEIAQLSESLDGLVKEHIITSAQGKEMFRQYQENRAKVMQPLLLDIYENKTFEDTKFIWYSLDDIKGYLEYIESIQKANPKQDVSGLRIYFAAYPNSKKFKEGKAIKHPGQQTVFMIPTVGIEGVQKYKSMNHLPFVIKPSSSNALKGQFEIVEELMHEHDKEKRLKLYDKKLQSLQKAGVSFSSSLFANRAEETSTIYNEGEMIPPPYKD